MNFTLERKIYRKMFKDLLDLQTCLRHRPVSLALVLFDSPSKSLHFNMKTVKICCLFQSSGKA